MRKTKKHFCYAKIEKQYYYDVDRHINAAKKYETLKEVRALIRPYEIIVKVYKNEDGDIIACRVIE